MKPHINYLSSFTGVAGFDLGLDRAGMKCVGQIEIDKHCRSVLRYHYPNIKRYGNIENVETEELESVELISGGFPCQDLSVAGKRKGLAGSRSGLFFEFARIVSELKPRWFVLENVPGLLSSQEGRDFAIILRWLEKCGYLQAWRIFDSQYFRVAQRRRRVFIVGSLGDGSCAEILFESESLCRNPAEGRKTGEGTTPDVEGGVRISGPLSARDYKDPGVDGCNFESAKMVPVATLRSGGCGGVPSSRGEHLVCGAVSAKWAKGTGGPAGDECYNLVSVTETGRGFWSEGKPRLRVSTAPSQPQTIIAQQVQWASGGGKVLNDTVQSLRSEAEHNYQFIAYRTSGNMGVMKQGDKTAALNCATDPNQNIVRSKMSVRRLTPRECERLQGFPDDWTRYGIDENGNKIKISDTQRYKMMGNAVTVSVSEWIGKRIVKLW